LPVTAEPKNPETPDPLLDELNYLKAMKEK